ncbi:MAG: hypothetical protein HN348_25155 [Proteobacteria bacterium]|jgi:hypothetical protein|nr:hypothetical protein [Pseudomonadota bacterium]
MGSGQRTLLKELAEIALEKGRKEDAALYQQLLDADKEEREIRWAAERKKEQKQATIFAIVTLLAFLAMAIPLGRIGIPFWWEVWQRPRHIKADLTFIDAVRVLQTDEEGLPTHWKSSVASFFGHVALHGILFLTINSNIDDRAICVGGGKMEHATEMARSLLKRQGKAG